MSGERRDSALGLRSTASAPLPGAPGCLYLRTTRVGPRTPPDTAPAPLGLAFAFAERCGLGGLFDFLDSIAMLDVAFGFAEQLVPVSHCPRRRVRLVLPTKQLVLVIAVPGAAVRVCWALRGGEFVRFPHLRRGRVHSGDGLEIERSTSATISARVPMPSCS